MHIGVAPGGSGGAMAPALFMTGYTNFEHIPYKNADLNYQSILIF